MRRFYLSPGSVCETTITVQGQEARHIAVVLRLRPGDVVEFFDGSGTVFSATLDLVKKEHITATITGIHQADDQHCSSLVVAQALLKGKKMDFLIQKATELGVGTFLPLITKYCENHGNREHQAERWHRIMLEACKQCLRLSPMDILPLCLLNDADFPPATLRLAAWEGERSAPLPASLAQASTPVCLFFGPEGGLHDEDLTQLHNHRFSTFSLGPRILRGETATLAAISITQYMTGVLQPSARPMPPQDRPLRPAGAQNTL